MSLFTKSAAVELKEFKTKYAQLETEFNAFKDTHATFLAEKEALAAKLTENEAQITTLKEREASLASEVETLKAQVPVVTEAAVSATAVLELQKVGQAPIAQAEVINSPSVEQLYEDYKAIADPDKRRAFFIKNLKGK